MSKIEQFAAQMAFVSVNGMELQQICHGLAVSSGWWTDVDAGDLFTAAQRHAMVPTKLMLIVSEVSEGMEAHRKDLPDTHLPHRDGLEVELADAVIRAFDLAGALGYDLGAAMADKLAYNAKRQDHTLAARSGAGGKRY